MKRITDEQILGEKGVNLIQSTVLKMGFTWHSTNQAVEAGIDGWVELRDTITGEVGNCWLAVQSRARSELREDDTNVYFNCTLKDVEYWMQGSSPVMLVVSKPEENVAWWISVKDYFEGKDIQNDRSVSFDKERDVLTPSTAEDWKALGNRYGAATYFTPPRQHELLTSNMLRISRFGSTVFSAKTTFDSGKEFREQLKKKEEYPPWEWAFGKEHRVYSYYDLREHPWSGVCDVRTVEELDPNRLSVSEAVNDRSVFVQLLKGCFRDITGSWRMRYSWENDCHYFAPNRSTVTRDLTYKSRKKRTSRQVVSEYFSKKDSTRIAYYRHDGFSHRFLRFGDTWYLMIEPTYVFTSDGTEPDPYREEHLSKIKSIEGDAAISGKIIMYSEIFKDRDDLIQEPYEFLGFNGIETAEIDVGVDDDAWARIKASKPEAKETKADSAFGAGLFD